LHILIQKLHILIQKLHTFFLKPLILTLIILKDKGYMYVGNRNIN